MGMGVACQLTDQVKCLDCGRISQVMDLAKKESGSYAQSTVRRAKPILFYCCKREYPCVCQIGDELFVPPLARAKLVA